MKGLECRFLFFLNGTFSELAQEVSHNCIRSKSEFPLPSLFARLLCFFLHNHSSKVLVETVSDLNSKDTPTHLR